MHCNFWKLSIGLYLTLSLYVASVHAVSGPVGSVDGSFSVTPGGAASYVIPIKVPAGIGGIKPNISLTYNSQAGNGLLGVGWNLSGLSTITRCPQNMAQDGQIRDVKLDAEDRFCLDGQRLVAVEGAYGENNTEYRTEQDSFSKIISKGFVDHGPESFEVLTKDGQRLQFGDVAVDADGRFGSRIAPHGKEVVHIWAISRISDNVGNAINFRYYFVGDEDPETGLTSGDGYNREYYPSNITYSGGGHLDFDYGDLIVTGDTVIRPDPIISYRGGGKLRNKGRLKQIRVGLRKGLFEGIERVREYLLAYKPVDDSNQSRLSTVTECGADGQQCLPATQISWLSDQNTDKPKWASSADIPPLPSDVLLTNSNAQDRGVRFVDLDGDGTKDIVYHWVSPPAGPPMPTYNHNDSNLSDYHTRFNAWLDEFMDWLLVQEYIDPNLEVVGVLEEEGEATWLAWVDEYSTRQVETGAYLYKNNTWQPAPGFHPPHLLIRADEKATGVNIIDINGDGLVDFVYSRQENATTHYSATYLNNGSAWVKDTSGRFDLNYPLGRYDNQHRVAQFTDLNGDGLVDVVYKNRVATRTCTPAELRDCTSYIPTTEQGAYLGTATGWSENKLAHIPPIALDPVVAYYVKNRRKIGTCTQDGVYEGGSVFELPGGEISCVARPGLVTVYDAYQTSDGVRLWDKGDSNPRLARLMDVNGDGLSDLLFDSLKSDRGVYLKTSEGWEPSPTANYRTPIDLYYGDDSTSKGQLGDGVVFEDVNGDGLVDILQSYDNFVAAERFKSAYLNTGNGWVQNDNYILPTSINDFGGVIVYLFRDVNADGLVDFLFHAAGDTQAAYLNTGSRWQRDDRYNPPYDLVHDYTNSPTSPQVSNNGNNAGTRVLDLNGDGKLDVVHSSGETAEILSMQVERHLVNGITTGLGAHTAIIYKPLTDATVYTSGMVGCQGPVICVNASPSLVVSTHSTSNGIGGMAHYTYQYADARMHRLGRGWLGFASRTTRDLQTGQITTTTYDNTSYNAAFKVFPFLNLPQKVTVSYPGKLFGNNPVVVSETINHYAVKYLEGQPYYSVYVQNSTAETTDLDNGLPLKYIRTTTKMDDYGNALSITADTRQSPFDAVVAYRQTTINTYDNDPVNWHLGRLKTVSVTSSTGSDSQTRHTAYGYYPLGHAHAGMLQWTEDEPNDPDLYLKTAYTYDERGNTEAVTISGSASASHPVATRTTRNDFDYTNRLRPTVTTTVPVPGTTITHSATKVYDARWGKLIQQTGPNANRPPTRWTYDNFGRRKSETLPDGHVTTWIYGWCDAHCPQHAVYKVTTARSDGARSTVYQDKFSRTLRTQTLGLDGVVVLQDQEYDAAGRVWRSSRPYFAGASKRYWSSKIFDTLSRVKTRINPDGSVVSNDYQGLQTTVSTERRTGGDYTRLSTRQIKNLAGQVEWVFDAHNNGTRYTYLPFGELETVTDPLGNVIIMDYDNRGRKIKMIDPDMGIWRYASDALGNLRWQQDAKKQEVTMEYDLLNRLLTRVDVLNPDDPSSVEKTSQWHYFSAADPDSSCRSIGQLKSSSDGAITRNYCYDDFGRSTSSTVSFDGASYKIATDYDEFSRIKTVTYPTQGVGDQAVTFMVRNDYDDYGHLKSVHDGASDKLLWIAEQVNASGNVTTETLGNGLTTARVYDAALGSLDSIRTGAGGSGGVQDLAFDFDSLGALISRTDHNRMMTQANGSPQNGSTESFTYDALNRVSTVLRDGRQTAQYQYDALGNITFNSQLGTYLYNSKRPHAVTDIKRSNTGTLAGDISNDGRINALDAALLARSLVGLSVLNSPQLLRADCNTAHGVNLDDSVCIAAHAGSTSSTIDEKLTYDANGNMLHGIAGKVVTYTAFNKPETITRSGYSSRFAYDTDRARYWQVVTDAGGTTTTHYVGGLFERIEKPDGVIEYKNYIHAGGRMVAISTRRSDNSRDLNYLHQDHIGSITAITDAEGLVKARFSYDVFGKRRDDAKWKAASAQESSITAATDSDITHRGFTEHELLAGVGLIHMNGRVFDPELGRFLSPDPFVQFAHNLQSYNRYSYVLNNPLSFTDPSGYFLTGLIKDIRHRVFGALEDVIEPAANFVSRHHLTIVGTAFAGMPGNPVVLGMLSGFISSGGSFEAAVIGGISAGIFHGLAYEPDGFGKVVAHGMVGGASSAMNGGSFKAGFISAAVAKRVSQAVGPEVFGNVHATNGGWARLKNAFAAGAIGGTTSVIAGGKFANGAVSAAFIRLFSATHPTQHDAARTAIDLINPTSVIEGREYGGMVYQNADGSYSYTGPIRGTRLGVNPGGPRSVPSGTTAIAFWHTHGAADVGATDEAFTGTVGGNGDKGYASYYKIDAYLGTPAGAFKYYERSTDKVYLLGTVRH